MINPMPHTQTDPGSMPTPGAAVQQPTDPLANLRDIQLPSDISTIPAFGWWLLAAIILLAISAFVFVLWRRYQQRQYRRSALRLQQDLLNTQQSESQKLQALNALLKRVALRAYPSVDVAGLHGEHWRKFLERSAPRVAVNTNVDRVLTHQLYSGQAISSDELSHFDQFVTLWINKHGALAPDANRASTLGGDHAHV